MATVVGRNGDRVELPYRDGIAAVRLEELSQMRDMKQGSRDPKNGLKTVIKEEDLTYYEEVLKGETVAFLTPKNLPELFEVPKWARMKFPDLSKEEYLREHNPDYSMLERRIKEGDFNEVASQPFIITGRSKLRKVDGSIEHEDSVDNAIRKSDAYTLGDKLFVVTEMNAGYFGRDGSPTIYEIHSIQEHIREHFFETFLPEIEKHC